MIWSDKESTSVICQNLKYLNTSCNIEFATRILFLLFSLPLYANLSKIKHTKNTTRSPLTAIINISLSSPHITILLKLAVGDAQSQNMEESAVDMQTVAVCKSPEAQFNNNNNHINNNASAIPNHVKLTANFNFHVDEQGNIGRVDVSKAFCFQTQDMSNNVMAKNVVVMKKQPIMMTSSPNGEAHFVDCNNNLSGPTIIEAGHMPPPPQIFSQKHYPPSSTHPMSPLNINIHPPQFVNHLNWNQAAQYQ